MKQVEFDIELVKKIQSGEVKGRVLTRSGRNARFLGEFITDTNPLVFAITINGKEIIVLNRKDGRYSTEKNSCDLIIEIEEPKQECQFKPFDKVLVRDVDNEEWSVGIYSHYASGCDFPYFCAGLTAMRQCIPYEGNEHLVGTTDKPKED